MSTPAHVPVVVLGVELPAALHAACDSSRVETAVAAHASGLLARLGLPGRAEARVVIARRDNRPLRLSVHGVDCPYPTRMLLSAAAELEVGEPVLLDGGAPVHSPATWVRWVEAQLDAAASKHDAERWAERFVVWVAGAALTLNAGRLVDSELAAAYAGDCGEAVDVTVLCRVLAALLDFGVSVDDRATVLGYLDAAAGVGPDVVAEQLFRLMKGNVVRLRVHPDLAAEVLGAPPTGEVDVAELGDEEARRQFGYVLEAFRSDLGVPAPDIRVVADPGLPPGGMVMQVHDQRGWSASGLSREELLVREPATRLAELGLTGRPMYNPYTGEHAAAVSTHAASVLDAHGVAYWEGSGYVAFVAHLALRRRIWQLIGPAEVEFLLVRLEVTHPRLADLLMELYSVTDLTCLVRQLVAESVPVVDLSRIAEALVQSDPDTMIDVGAGDRWHTSGAVDREALVSKVRQTLRGLVTGSASANGPIHVLRTPDTFEDAVAAALAHEPPAGDVLADLLDRVWLAVERAVAAGARPVVVTSPGGRPSVRRLLEQEMPEQPVWSTAEIAPDIDVVTLPWPGSPD